jgi:hypothetical protein
MHKAPPGLFEVMDFGECVDAPSPHNLRFFLEGFTTFVIELGFCAAKLNIPGMNPAQVVYAFTALGGTLMALGPQHLCQADLIGITAGVSCLPMV